jgi:hypothetical protein
MPYKKQQKEQESKNMMNEVTEDELQKSPLKSDHQ